MNDQTEKSAIEKLLLSYGEALNASSVNLVLSLYTEDIVFMPYNASPANGKEELKAAYESAFKTVRLDVEFHIDEIEIMGDFAFARTVSKATALILANEQTVPDNNRELFILQKVSGQWKIARYMFVKKQ